MPVCPRLPTLILCQTDHLCSDAPPQVSKGVRAPHNTTVLLTPAAFLSPFNRYYTLPSIATMTLPLSPKLRLRTRDKRVPLGVSF